MEGIVKPVFWTTRAKKDLDKVIRFNAELHGLDKAIEIARNIQKCTQVLEIPDHDFASIGSVDEDFIHLKRKYRKLINLNHKITYRVGKTKIYIVRVFDTRQNPRKNR